MFSEIQRDLTAALKRDPAARSKLEILLSYAGVRAILMHRMAHWMWSHGLKITARCFSELARFLTGIEIHPAAKIGHDVFIDHGTGVVIGETAEVGDGVLMYQGVTLGGTGRQRGKRHPTIGSNVTLGAGAKILGAITIGDNTVIGAGSVVLKPIPANATAVGVPARVVVQNGQRVAEPSLEHGAVPDPCDKCMEQFDSRVAELRARLESVERELRQGAEARRPLPAAPPEA